MVEELPLLFIGSKFGAETCCLGSGMSLFFFLSRFPFFLGSFSSFSLFSSKSDERGRFFCRLFDFLLPELSGGPR